MIALVLMHWMCAGRTAYTETTEVFPDVVVVLFQLSFRCFSQHTILWRPETWRASCPASAKGGSRHYPFVAVEQMA